jgi:hypothetical protein
MSLVVVSLIGTYRNGLTAHPEQGTVTVTAAVRRAETTGRSAVLVCGEGTDRRRTAE